MGCDCRWNPTTWHATEVQSVAMRRRAIGWNYGVFGGKPGGGGTRLRDAAAVKYVFAGEWEGWPEARKRLWGLLEPEPAAARL